MRALKVIGVTVLVVGVLFGLRVLVSAVPMLVVPWERVSDSDITAAFRTHKAAFERTAQSVLQSDVHQIEAESYDNHDEDLRAIFEELQYRGVFKSSQPSRVWFVRVSLMGFQKGVVYCPAQGEPVIANAVKVVRITDGWYLYEIGM